MTTTPHAWRARVRPLAQHARANLRRWPLTPLETAVASLLLSSTAVVCTIVKVWAS